MRETTYEYKHTPFKWRCRHFTGMNNTQPLVNHLIPQIHVVPVHSAESCFTSWKHERVTSTSTSRASVDCHLWTAFILIHTPILFVWTNYTQVSILPGPSPDLNLCDIFLLGLFKRQSIQQYQPHPPQNIRREIANISVEALQRVNQNLLHQREECLHVDRHHFLHLIWSANCNYFKLNVIGQYTH